MGRTIALARALVFAIGARAVIAQVQEIEVAAVAIGPGNIHTRAGGHVNPHGDRLFGEILGDCHQPMLANCDGMRLRRRISGLEGNIGPGESGFRADTCADDSERCRSSDRVRG